MKKKNWINTTTASLVVLLGLGGQLALSLWLEPFVFNKDVVKIKAGVEGLPLNYVLQEKDLYIAKVQKDQVPEGAFTSTKDLIGKSTAIKVTNGMMLTSTLVDVNLLHPGVGEGVYPIPKDAIYAINGSLRANDTVKIDLIIPSNRVLDETTLSTSREVFIKETKVAYVRSDENNDVTDTENGNTNDRRTSTGRVSYPEVILTDEQGIALKEKLEQGYKLWIVRIN